MRVRVRGMRKSVRVYVRVRGVRESVRVRVRECSCEKACDEKVMREKERVRFSPV